MLMINIPEASIIFLEMASCNLNGRNANSD